MSPLPCSGFLFCTHQSLTPLTCLAAGLEVESSRHHHQKATLPRELWVPNMVTLSLYFMEGSWEQGGEVASPLCSPTCLWERTKLQDTDTVSIV